jgi:hypothetical protein
MKMRSRVPSTRESESTSTSSPLSFSVAPSASKSRTMNSNTTQRSRRSEGLQRYGPFIAGLGVTLVMLYMILMISQLDPTPRHLQRQQQQQQQQQQQRLHQQLNSFTQNVQQAQEQVQQQLAKENQVKGQQQAQEEEQSLLKGECQYDGHCPLRSTCEASGGATGGGIAGAGRVRAKGICRPMESRGKDDPTADDDPTATESCVSACRTELQMDEHFYQEAWPVEEWYEPVPASTGRPRGCIYVYHREPEGNRWKALQLQDASTKWKEVPPSVRNWTEHRFRHVIRVDPANDNVNDKLWMAYCHNTCVADADCATAAADASSTSTPPFTCQLGACQRNQEYWNPTMDKNGNEHGNKNDDPTFNHPEMVIVTGATSTYMRGLTNLCASLRYWAPHHKVVVYNLGNMTAEQIQDIEGWSNVMAVEWRDGVPTHYPPHVSRGKIYAWKPIIVNETLHKYKSIFWLDAGSSVAGPITPIEDVIQRTGIMLVKGQDTDMKEKSAAATYKWFNTTKATFKAGPHYSGNTQAFMYPSRYVESVVLPNALCAMDPNCITPPGSLLRNHRYDQTTISILAYMPKVRAPHYTEYLAASKRQLNPDMRKPSFKMIWTSRQSVNYFTDWGKGRDAPHQFERVLTSA